jgi:hypothetical protein
VTEEQTQKIQEQAQKILDGLRETKIVMSNLRQQIEIWQVETSRALERVREDFYNLDAKVNRMLRNHRERGVLE